MAKDNMYANGKVTNLAMIAKLNKPLNLRDGRWEAALLLLHSTKRNLPSSLELTRAKEQLPDGVSSNIKTIELYWSKPVKTA
jgi:hypothetical protein